MNRIRTVTDQVVRVFFISKVTMIGIDQIGGYHIVAFSFRRLGPLADWLALPPYRQCAPGLTRLLSTFDGKSIDEIFILGERDGCF
ncbi:hypothetical protein [Brucella endophytica]|uniref:hypothetical protein n=1 Tax=Brucella endophytica TaxID=1963359 RepID=UPI001668F3B0|nr:hypothetical protein [Brucella endophytica]